MTDQIIGGNVYNKYRSKNPIVRILMNGFFGAFDDLVDLVDPKSAYEVGCGEGELLLRLAARGIKVSGSDIVSEMVEIARRRLPTATLHQRDLVSLADQGIDADLIICCEVLEHVQDVDGAFAALRAIARRNLLLSVPREPIWRGLNMLRGKYLAHFGNTPGHVNHWSTTSFLTLVGKHFDIIKVRHPLPWTMVLCRSKAMATFSR